MARPDASSEDSGMRDVVVVGSGAAAFTAALTAANAGLRVLLVEKTPWLGGTTATSGGYAWLPIGADPAMPGSVTSAAALHGGMQATGAAPPSSTASHPGGEEDSVEEATRYLESMAGVQWRPDMVRAFLAAAPRMLHFLHTETAVRFWRLPWYVDYWSEAPGAKVATRSFGAITYDGRALGRDIRRVRPAHPMLTVMGGMNLDAEDLQHLFRATTSLASLWHAAKRASAYAWDLAVCGRGRRMTNGNALIGRCLQSARDAGVEIWTDTPATGLVRRNGRIEAVEVRHSRAVLRIPVRHAVVLASGGFAHDPALRSEFLPFPHERHSVTVDSNEGDGARMATAVGAVVRGAGYHNYAGIAVSAFRDAQGCLQKMLHSRSLQKPGVIAVNAQGMRFANEAAPYNDFQEAVSRTGTGSSWLICDHRHLRAYGFGWLRPGPPWLRPIGPFIAAGYLFRATTIEGLAHSIGVPEASLKQTIAQFNAMAHAGVDSDFQRGETRYDRMAADPRNLPHPSLGALERPPFYAIRLHPGDMGTFAGIDTDARARVLEASGEPIPGLYACGLDMRNAFSGHYPGGGGSIGPGMVFGFIAGLDIVEGARADMGTGAGLRAGTSA